MKTVDQILERMEGHKADIRRYEGQKKTNTKLGKHDLACAFDGLIAAKKRLIVELRWILDFMYD